MADVLHKQLIKHGRHACLLCRERIIGLLITCASLALLLSGSWLYWQFRYEEYPGYARMVFHPGEMAPYLVMSSPESIVWDPVAGNLSIHAEKGKSPTAEIDLGVWPCDGYAHVHILGRAKGLVPGIHDWNNGRVVAIWRNDDGTVQRGCAGLLGARGDEFSESDVIVPLSRPGHPSVTFQNLGFAGRLTIERLEVTLVRQRWWGVGVAVSLWIGWFFWWLFVMRRWVAPFAGSARLAVSGVLAVSSMYYMLLPGPWMPYRWIVTPFVIGSIERGSIKYASQSQGESSHPQAGKQTAVTTGTQGLISNCLPRAEVPGELYNSRFWEVVYWLRYHGRWMLHFFVFAGMAVILVTVLRTPRAAFPVAFVAVGTEAMETLLGFGFDKDDVVDLVMDGSGIWLGARLTFWCLGRIKWTKTGNV